MYWPSACEFHNSMPALLAAFSYCFLYEIKVLSHYTVYFIEAVERPGNLVKKHCRKFYATCGDSFGILQTSLSGFPCGQRGGEGHRECNIWEKIDQSTIYPTMLLCITSDSKMNINADPKPELHNCDKR